MWKEKQHCLHLTKQAKSYQHSQVLRYTSRVSRSFICHWFPQQRNLQFLWFYWVWIVKGYPIWCHTNVFHSCLYFILKHRITLSFVLQLCNENRFVKCQTLALEHKINKSNAKLSTHRVIGLCSEDICYEIFVVNKSLDFDFMFTTKASRVCHTITIVKQSPPVCSYWLVLIKIFWNYFLNKHPWT